jgi:hypothetical protein
MTKKGATADPLLPTLVCAWCKGLVRRGAPKVSHGICKPCATRWFGKFRPARPAIAA